METKLQRGRLPARYEVNNYPTGSNQLLKLCKEKVPTDDGRNASVKFGFARNYGFPPTVCDEPAGEKREWDSSRKNV